ncbi:hypothetical protein ACFX2I_014890 [Malus domestica]
MSVLFSEKLPRRFMNGSESRRSIVIRFCGTPEMPLTIWEITELPLHGWLKYRLTYWRAESGKFRRRVCRRFCLYADQKANIINRLVTSCMSLGPVHWRRKAPAWMIPRRPIVKTAKDDDGFVESHSPDCSLNHPQVTLIRRL